MDMALVPLDALEVADVLEVLPVSGRAPFRWPWGWKLTVGSALDAAEAIALNLIGVPSSLKVCHRRGRQRFAAVALPFAATICRPGGEICRLEPACPANPAFLASCSVNRSNLAQIYRWTSGN